jgi:crossover junction endodeoxyribonuclease RuvC
MRESDTQSNADRSARVLSVDPGYDRVGFAILERDVHKNRVLYSDCFRTARGMPFYKRLLSVGDEMERLMAAYQPRVVALEKLYFASNQKTAIAVSEARGVFLLIAARHGCALYEYTPLQVKNAITGNGRSDKQHVTKMLAHLVALEARPRYDDEYDAIAVGLTCLASERL